jgi:hypothetical protein
MIHYNKVVKLKMADIIPYKYILESRDNIATIICDEEGNILIF